MNLRKILTRLVVLLGLLSVFLGGFFLNPWALDASISKIFIQETPNFWYWNYHIIPSILNKNVETFPQVDPNDGSYHCRYLEVYPVGSLFISHCEKNDKWAANWVFGIADPEHLWRFIQNPDGH